MATLITVKAKIKAILETKEGEGESLNVVYGFMKAEPQKFPAAMVEYLENDEERLDTQTNEVDAKYLIKVLLRDTNDQDVSTLRLSLITELTDLFRTPPNVDTLDSEVTIFDVGKVTAFNAQEDMPYSGFDMILSAKFIQTIL